MKLAIKNGYTLLVTKHKIWYLPIGFGAKQIKFPDPPKLQNNEVREKMEIFPDHL